MDRARHIEIKGAISRGETLAAYDLALQALGETPGDVELQYLSVLALVRSGATRFADARYRALGLDAVEADGQLGIDIGSLLGRIAKDRALAATDPAKRQAHLDRAIEAYQTIADKTKDAYPLVNVAALCLWAGDTARSRRAAEKVLAHLALVPEQSRDYWHFATSAEARLLAGDVSNAASEIAAAATLSGVGNARKWQELAVTASQLRRNCRAAGIDDVILAPLHVPPIIVYAGDRAGAGLDADGERQLAETIRRALAQNEAWTFFGGLRAGFEILLAETVIERGAELNVVLPFPAEIFVDREVRPHGDGWITRFNACLAKSKSIRFATEHGYSGRTVPRYARRLAMGYAILLARRLDTAAIMIAGTAEGGDCLDAASAWTGTGREVVMLAIGGAADVVDGAVIASDPPGGCVEGASLFGDFTGFSQLPEDLVGAYADRVLGGIADILDRHGDDVVARNSWGDAIVAQFNDARQAARCAIDLQTFLGEANNVTLAPDVVMRMRIGLHYGPVQRVFDKVQGRVSFLGKHVVQAARIEPVAIPGMIYVSEPFAAALAVDAQDDFVCDYLGILDTAKSFGKMSLYALRSARAA